MSLQFLTHPPFTDIARLKDQARKAAKANGTPHTKELDAIGHDLLGCKWSDLLQDHTARFEHDGVNFTVDELPVHLASMFSDDSGSPIAVGERVGISVEPEIRAVRNGGATSHLSAGLRVTYSPNLEGAAFVLDIPHPTTMNDDPLSPEAYGSENLPLRHRLGPVVEAVRSWMMQRHREDLVNPLDLPDEEFEALTEIEHNNAEIAGDDFFDQLFEVAEGWGTPRQKYHLGFWLSQMRPLFSDAYLLMAGDETLDPQMRTFLLRLGTQVAWRCVQHQIPLAPEDIHWWGDLETRDYMRETRLLAEGCLEDGDADSAIVLLQDLLTLNPGDNQGNRYPLIGQLLLRGRPEDKASATAILDQFDAAYDPTLLYAGALLAFQREGDNSEARDWRSKAYERGPMVPRFLEDASFDMKLESYLVGRESEALFCAMQLRGAYLATPGAMSWIKPKTPLH